MPLYGGDYKIHGRRLINVLPLSWLENNEKGVFPRTGNAPSSFNLDFQAQKA